jgi:hypothetical protein
VHNWTCTLHRVIQLVCQLVPLSLGSFCWRSINMLCYVVLCYVMLCYVMLCYVMLCYATLRYVTILYATLRYVTLCCVMLCYERCCYGQKIMTFKTIWAVWTQLILWYTYSGMDFLSSVRSDWMYSLLVVATLVSWNQLSPENRTNLIIAQFVAEYWYLGNVVSLIA